MTDRNLLRAQLLIEAADLLQESGFQKDIDSYMDAISKLDYKNITSKDYEGIIFAALGLGLYWLKEAKTDDVLERAYNLLGLLPPFFLPNVLKNVDKKEKILATLRKNCDAMDKTAIKLAGMLNVNNRKQKNLNDDNTDKFINKKCKFLSNILNAFDMQLRRNSK